MLVLAPMGSLAPGIGAVIYEIWKGDRDSALVGKDNDSAKALFDPDMKLVRRIDAETWDEAMRQYHEFMGWEPYRPMD